jgi:macrodomain Ter protein organizer (MatP/YcbG family)
MAIASYTKNRVDTLEEENKSLHKQLAPLGKIKRALEALTVSQEELEETTRNISSSTVRSHGEQMLTSTANVVKIIENIDKHIPDLGDREMKKVMANIKDLHAKCRKSLNGMRGIDPGHNYKVLGHVKRNAKPTKIRDFPEGTITLRVGEEMETAEVGHALRERLVDVYSSIEASTMLARSWTRF